MNLDQNTPFRRASAVDHRFNWSVYTFTQREDAQAAVDWSRAKGERCEGGLAAGAHAYIGHVADDGRILVWRP